MSLILINLACSLNNYQSFWDLANATWNICKDLRFPFGACMTTIEIMKEIDIIDVILRATILLFIL